MNSRDIVQQRVQGTALRTPPKLLPSVATSCTLGTLCEMPNLNNTLTGDRNERNRGKKIL